MEKWEREQIGVAHTQRRDRTRDPAIVVTGVGVEVTCL